MKQAFLLIGMLILGFNPMYGETMDTEKQAILKVIDNFAEGADRRDTALINIALFDDSNQFFNGPKGVVALTKSQYLQMLEEGQIGGVDRQLTTPLIDIKDDIAVVKAVMTGEKASFHNYVTLMKIGKDWKIMNNVLKMEVHQ